MAATTEARQARRDRVHHPLFARLFDRLSGPMERELAHHRHQLLANLRGRVLELGAGNGSNFGHYPAAVAQLVAVEPEPYLRTKAHRAAIGASVSIAVVDAVADALPTSPGSCTSPRPACCAPRALVSVAVAHGAQILRERARPDGPRVALDSGAVVEADRVVWACGGWLAGLFPGLIALRVTQQELYFFDGGPAWRGVGGWVDYDRATYGTGDLDGLGAKAAWDVEGPPVDPDAPLPAPTAEIERLARGYLGDRFGELARARLVGAKTCRYEITPDSHFLVGPHPEHPEVWIVGGGSGHGFKHGPALAERIVGAWDGGAPLPARFAIGERAAGRSLRTAGTR